MFRFTELIILLGNIKFTTAILRSKETLERKTTEQNRAMIQNIIPLQCYLAQQKTLIF